MGIEPADLLDSYELRIFALAHPNCLLIGPDALVDDAVTALKPLFRRAPLFIAGQPLDLPASPAGTFLVRDVGELNASQQAALSSWIECAPGRVQVISTTRRPLFPAVEASSFLASLYYRLNTLTISLVRPESRAVPYPALSSEARNLTE